MLSLELLAIRELNSCGMSVCLKPCLPEVITPTLANEIRHFQDSLAEKYYIAPWEDNFYILWYHHRGHGNCCRGLDFNFILNAFSSSKEVAFEAYVSELFDLLYLNYVGLGLPIINCSIVDREISGISQEFFLLNKINFIKSQTHELDILQTKIFSVNLPEVANNLVFPEAMYKDNLFYKFCYFDLRSMRSLIEKAEAKNYEEGDLEKIRRIFEGMKIDTISQIYNLASQNLKLLERFARQQYVN